MTISWVLVDFGNVEIEEYQGPIGINLLVFTDFVSEILGKTFSISPVQVAPSASRNYLVT